MADHGGAVDIDDCCRPSRGAIQMPLAAFVGLVAHLVRCGNACRARLRRLFARYDRRSQAIAKAAKEELKKKDKPKPDFDPVKLRILPQKTDEKDVALRYVKPGHWTAAVEELEGDLRFSGAALRRCGPMPPGNRLSWNTRPIE